RAAQTIDTLVAHHVAVTSTLAVFEGAARPPMNSGIMKRSHELISRKLAKGDARGSQYDGSRPIDSGVASEAQFHLRPHAGEAQAGCQCVGCLYPCESARSCAFGMAERGSCEARRPIRLGLP